MTIEQTTIDFSKVTSAHFYWRNQEYNIRLKHKPMQATVRAVPVGNEPAAAHHDFPSETMIERAKRLDLLDKWVAVARFQMYSQKLEFVGEDAKAKWNAYNAYYYGTK